MVTIDDILAPGRALELLSRRAARGHRPALRLLLRCAPVVLEAEERWLHPVVMKARPGGAGGAWRMSHDGEHEQMLELVARVARGPTGRADAMFRALHGLLLRHLREEREWLVATIAQHGAADEQAFARYVAQCRPVLAAVAALGAPGSTDRADLRSGAAPLRTDAPLAAANDEAADDGSAGDRTAGDGTVGDRTADTSPRPRIDDAAPPGAFASGAPAPLARLSAAGGK